MIAKRPPFKSNSMKELYKKSNFSKVFANSGFCSLPIRIDKFIKNDPLTKSKA